MHVQGKGDIALEDVQLGDSVMTAYGYSEVYAFGTRELHKKTDFLMITTGSSHTLELSQNHLLFTGAKMEPKLASEVNEGDSLTLLPGKSPVKVVSVTSIKKRGAVHPLTRDGTIVVNGILASAHSVDVFSPVVKIAGRTLIDKQQFQQMLLAPLRMLCTLSRTSFCGEKNHAFDDGTHHWIEIVEAIQLYLSPESVSVHPETKMKGGFQVPVATEIDFLSLSPFLPLKLFILLWMIVFSVVEAAFFSPRFYVGAISALLLYKQATTIKATAEKIGHFSSSRKKQA